MKSLRRKKEIIDLVKYSLFTLIFHELFYLTSSERNRFHVIEKVLIRMYLTKSFISFFTLIKIYYLVNNFLTWNQLQS